MRIFKWTKEYMRIFKWTKEYMRIYDLFRLQYFVKILRRQVMFSNKFFAVTDRWTYRFHYYTYYFKGLLFCFSRRSASCCLPFSTSAYKCVLADGLHPGRASTSTTSLLPSTPTTTPTQTLALAPMTLKLPFRKRTASLQWKYFLCRVFVACLSYLLLVIISIVARNNFLQ